MVQIRIGEVLKQRLDEIKAHPRETYGDIIQRLIVWWDGTDDMKDMDTPLKKMISRALESKFSAECTKVEDKPDGTHFYFAGDPTGTPVWIPKR